jgi:hypothetical protein
MCVLRAAGEEFAVDEFLRTSNLAPLITCRKGTSRFPDVSARLDRYSGFNIAVSDANFSDLQSQISDAVQFLQRNAQELRRLLAFPGVTSVALDFPIAERDVAAQSETFPAILLKLLGDLRIELSFTLYPAEQESSA